MTSLSNLIRERTFQRLALLTVIAVYLLIAVGGIVRSTGSGMGCPDWPKCFGQWIPPTDVSELPANYQEIYSHRGYANTEFNVAKTWTEYLNRLLGALIGLFIFLTFLASLRYWKADWPITVFSFLAFVLVGVQGWLGARVVASVLTPWLITLHMLLAIVIVGILLYVTVRTYADRLRSDAPIPNKRRLNGWLIISTTLLLLQVLLGTQVREMVDEVAKQLGQAARGSWIDALGLPFIVHRSFSLVVFGSQVAWLWQLRQAKANATWLQVGYWTIAIIVAEILTGVVMAYWAIPGWAQPVHLTLAVLALGIQFALILLVNRERLLRSATTLRTVEPQRL